jgi:hypothetical protein
MQSNAEEDSIKYDGNKFPTKFHFNLSRILLILLVLLAIFFLVVIFIGAKRLKSKSPFEEKILVLSQQLTSSGEATSFTTPFINSLKKIPTEKDSKLQYKSLFNIAAGVAAQYSSSHNPNLRKFLESLGSFAQTNYQDNYKKSDFFILCSDTECGTSSLPPEIVKIKEQIEKNDLGKNKKAMINVLNDVAFATDNGKTEAERNRKNHDYSILFTLLKGEAQNGNKVASELVSSLEKYLDSNKIATSNPNATNSANMIR